MFMDLGNLPSLSLLGDIYKKYSGYLVDSLYRHFSPFSPLSDHPEPFGKGTNAPVRKHTPILFLLKNYITRKDSYGEYHCLGLAAYLSFSNSMRAGITCVFPQLKQLETSSADVTVKKF